MKKLKKLNRIKKKKVLGEETHAEADEIWHIVSYFAIGRKTRLILNHHIGYRDYRDIITFLEGIPEEIRKSERITFVSDSYVNYLNPSTRLLYNCQ